MNNKKLFIITCILGLILIIEVSFSKANFFSNEEESNSLEETNNTVTILDTDNKTTEEIDLEEYIIGVVASEMPALFNAEALKAQAVASRTYALYKKSTSTTDYDLLTDVTDQVYSTTEELKEKWQDNYDEYYNYIKEAVMATEGQVLLYEGNIIEAFYFSMSNGYTESSQSVFQENLPYLNSVESIWETTLSNFSVTTTLTEEEFCNKLSLDCSEGIIIDNLTESSTQRVESITINNTTFTGVEFRKLLNLRSTDFDITIEDSSITITTNGYGHGVGMSQYGANEMAKNGYTYEEILTYYYQGVEITNL